MPPPPVIPRFGSRLSSSQRTEPGPEQLMGSGHSGSEKRGKKRNKSRASKVERPLLKVKFPKLTIRALTAEASWEQTPTEMMLKPSRSENKSPKNHGASSASAAVDGDVFLFTQEPSAQPAKEKEKAKLSVLRTISKMLEENQLIRNRLISLSQSF